MQGKFFQKCTHLLYCSVLSLRGNVNARRMSKPEIGSIFHIKNRWNILVIGNYYLQIPPRENWFLYVRRVYATAINFPCSITLLDSVFSRFISILFTITLRQKPKRVTRSLCMLWLWKSKLWIKTSNSYISNYSIKGTTIFTKQ